MLTMQRRRRYLLAEGISGSVLAGTPLGGSARNPQLRIQGTSAQYRDVSYGYSYTSVQVQLNWCRVCGKKNLTTYRIVFNFHDGSVKRVGQVTSCADCQKTSWMFVSNMPRAVSARKRAEKIVI